MPFDVEAILKTIGSTAVVAGFIVWATKALISQFLSRDIKRYESGLATELAEHKESLQRESNLMMAAVGENTQKVLIEYKSSTDHMMAKFQAQLLAAASREERIRQEVERWANPILDAVQGLEARITNILDRQGYIALSAATEKEIPPGWSITHVYFLQSTIFIFAQYFCYVRLLQERLHFDLFHNQGDKDVFLARIRAVGETLSAWPLKELGDPPPAMDRQVLNLQQRAIGEAVTRGRDDAARCLSFSVFLDKWDAQKLAGRLEPLSTFLDGLTPTDPRGQRLRYMLQALAHLRKECERILQPAHA